MDCTCVYSISIDNSDMEKETKRLEKDKTVLKTTLFLFYFYFKSDIALETDRAIFKTTLFLFYFYFKSDIAFLKQIKTNHLRFEIVVSLKI